MTSNEHRRVFGCSHGVAFARPAWDDSPDLVDAEIDCERCGGTGWLPPLGKQPKRLCRCARPRIRQQDRIPPSPFILARAQMFAPVLPAAEVWS